MTLKILSRWLLFIVAPFLIGITLYRSLIGPISPYFQLFTPFAFLMVVPVIYLSLDWKYIQTTRYGGRFGEVNAPADGIVSFPDSRIKNIDISKFNNHRVHLGRWTIFTNSDSMFTFFYDRFGKKWYYHYYNQDREDMLKS